MTSSLAARLRERESRPVILDGGLASELERRGSDVSGNLWSARVLRSEPDAVRAAHAAYFAAGAEVATTASYQATYDGFGAAGVSRAETTELLRRSVQLAAQARAEAEERDEEHLRPHRTRWVAASVGPYGAMLADGSEYRGDYGLDLAALRAFHRPRLEVLAEAISEIDDGVLACETVPTSVEVEALVAEIDALGVTAWISLTPSGGRTRTGEPLADAFELAAGSPNIVALGVNCCDPDEVDLALATGRAITAADGPPMLAYPNTGEEWDAAARGWVGPARFDAARARSWRDEGARALGGCCRVGPALLAQIVSAVR